MNKVSPIFKKALLSISTILLRAVGGERCPGPSGLFFAPRNRDRLSRPCSCRRHRHTRRCTEELHVARRPRTTVAPTCSLRSRPGLIVLTSKPQVSRRLRCQRSMRKSILPATFDIQLEVGNIAETVSVVAGADAPINTTDATLGNTFESRRIIDLPLNAGNVVGLLSLQPGVTRAGFVNGGRSDQANITLDGVDVNEQQSGLDVVTNQAFSSVLRVLRDATQEFRVVTTNPNADTGRSSGAQVSLATKSGTNSCHGSLFHFHRNTVTTANDFFNNKAGVFLPTDPQVISGTAVAGAEKLPRPPLLRNFFGGSIGGPIKHDKMLSSSLRTKVFAKQPRRKVCRLCRCRTWARASFVIAPPVARAMVRVPRARRQVSVA